MIEIRNARLGRTVLFKPTLFSQLPSFCFSLPSPHLTPLRPAAPKWKQAGLIGASAAAVIAQAAPVFAAEDATVDSTIEAVIGAVKVRSPCGHGQMLQ